MDRANETGITKGVFVVVFSNCKADDLEISLRNKHVDNVIALAIKLGHSFVHVCWQDRCKSFIELKDLTEEHNSQEDEYSLLKEHHEHIHENHDCLVELVLTG